MTWPLRSNGLSEVGQLSAVRVQRRYRFGERRDCSCEVPLARVPVSDCQRDFPPTSHHIGPAPDGASASAP